MKKKLFVAITGASGAIYAKALLENLANHSQHEILVSASEAGIRVLRAELGANATMEDGNFAQWLNLKPESPSSLQWLPANDISAAPASGSNPLDAMAVAPCSMRTLAAIAHGLADNLITRAADVCIKEGRRLVLVPREMPLSAIHLENMLQLARLGVRIVPPCPGFYCAPRTIDDLVRSVIQRVVEQMGLEFPDPLRWNP